MKHMDEKLGSAGGQVQHDNHAIEPPMSEAELLYMAATRVEQFRLRSKAGGWWSKTVKNDEE